MRRILRRTFVCLTLLAVLAGTVPVSASAAGFRDVPEDYWAADSIQRCVSLGFLRGQSATRFGTGGEISRGTFAVVLCRVYGWETPAVEESSFQDVPADAAYAGAVEALLSHEVLTTQRPDFRPDEALTREDLAVMLVRSMGYSSLPGLVQELSTHFQDLHTNTGYIAMAYNLGLTNGTSATTFSPERAVTREEVAVTLVSLYDKLHAAPPETAAILTKPEGASLPDLTGLDAAAIPAGRLMGVGGSPAITPAMSSETAAELRAAAEEKGISTLLHITAGPSALDAPLRESAELLAKYTAESGCDGLMLDFPEVKRDRKRSLTDLVRRLRTALGEETPLYLVVEAPVWTGREYEGYDYTSLADYADRLVLRVASYQDDRINTFQVAPVNPLDEVYYALASMKGRVELNRLSLMVDTSPAVWDRSGHALELKPEELARVLEAGSWEYSQRYHCAYMDSADGDTPVAVWYLNREAILSRRLMTQSFGVNHLCFSDWQNAPRGLLADNW